MPTKITKFCEAKNSKKNWIDGNCKTKLSIYYQEIKPASIPLYDIFTYMYPISIIGLFVGMGSFIFIIKKRGYKIWILYQ